MSNPQYCVAIRTLGTAGEKYRQTLLSLQQQTIPPNKILVYIAQGYPIPQETIGIEEYIYCPKGMVAQRVPYLLTKSILNGYYFSTMIFIFLAMV